MIKFEYKLLFFFNYTNFIFFSSSIFFFNKFISKDQMAVNDERYVFIVEWFDTSASLIRSYNFTYFMADKTIEMVLL